PPNADCPSKKTSPEWSPAPPRDSPIPDQTRPEPKRQSERSSARTALASRSRKPRRQNQGKRGGQTACAKDGIATHGSPIHTDPENRPLYRADERQPIGYSVPMTKPYTGVPGFDIGEPPPPNNPARVAKPDDAITLRGVRVPLTSDIGAAF